jgi:hypothetical protein
MSVKTRSTYDTDFAAWTAEQAALLRRGEVAGLDWPNLAEEIDAMGRRDRRELRSRLGNIVTHLAKLRCSQATAPFAGWWVTIARERAEITAILEDSPSLRPALPVLLERAMPLALELAAVELAEHGEREAAAAATRCVFSLAEVLDQ